MENTKPTLQKFITPVAIIVAGIIVAAALFFKPQTAANQGASVANSPEAVKSALVKSAQAAGISKKDFTACLDSEAAEKKVADQADEAQAAGASGTPFLVFEFGPAGNPTQKIVIPGAIPKELVESIISTKKLPAGIPPQTLPSYRPADATDHIRGSLDAPVRIVEYSDFDCPYCKQIHPALKSVTDTNTSVAWVYRHFPLTNLHPNAGIKAIASECAAELGGNDAFWKYTDELIGA